jgi:choline-sulfatase
LTKPIVQREFRALMDFAGPLPTPQMKRNYINFYGNLIKSSDAYLVNVLDTLQSRGLLDNTLVIRTADHGEMGLAHGGLRQKNFNVYEESLRVPLVYSNPQLFPTPRESNAIVSHVDFLPTLATLFGAPTAARARWQGVDYSALVLDPSATRPQDYTVFTYDDFQSGQASGPYPVGPNHIVAIREDRWKFAEYYDPSGRFPSQFEMYDLLADPFERANIAHRAYPRAVEQVRQFNRLRLKLDIVRKTRLQPL